MATRGRAKGLRVQVKSADSGGGHCGVGFSHCSWEPHDPQEVTSPLCTSVPHSLVCQKEETVGCKP